MRGLKWNGALLAASLLVGCAAVPEQSAEQPAGAEPVETLVAASEPAKVIDLNATAADPANTIVCREMLKEMSNVVITRCMTVADWETWERMQEQWAKEFLLRLQGFR